MTINKIHGKNFQSIKDLSIQLNPGVNSIVGHSDCGKTAFAFRLLNWVINNRPSGDEFHSWNGGDPYGSITLDEKYQVTRLKIKNANYYTLTPPDQTPEQIIELIGTQPNKRPRDHHVFEAFGTSVPAPITRALNISDINFQFQLDDVFMFSKSPGLIARQLNSVADLGVIDVAKKNINEREKTEKAAKEKAETDVKRYTEELTEFAWLPEAEGCLNKLEAQEQKIGQLINEEKRLGELIDEIVNTTTTLEEHEKNSLLPYAGETETLVNRENEITTKEREYTNLKTLVATIQFLETEIREYDSLVAMETEVNGLLTQIESAEIKRREYRILNELLVTIRSLERQVTEIDNEIGLYEREFEKLMDELGVCPVCGAPKDWCNQ